MHDEQVKGAIGSQAPKRLAFRFAGAALLWHSPVLSHFCASAGLTSWEPAPTRWSRFAAMLQEVRCSTIFGASHARNPFGLASLAVEYPGGCCVDIRWQPATASDPWLAAIDQLTVVAEVHDGAPGVLTADLLSNYWDDIPF